MFVDLGVYGLSTKPGFAGRADTLRRFEKFTLEKGGFQALYAETLMSYEEFVQMFKESEQFYSKVGCLSQSFPSSSSSCAGASSAPILFGSLSRRVPQGQQGWETGNDGEEKLTPRTASLNETLMLLKIAKKEQLKVYHVYMADKPKEIKDLDDY